MNSTEKQLDPLEAALNSGDFNAIENAISQLQGLVTSPEYQQEYPDLSSSQTQKFLNGLMSTLNTQVLTQFAVSVQGQVVGNMTIDPGTSESVTFFSQDYEWDQVSDLEKYGIPGAPNDSSFLAALTNAINGSGSDPILPAGDSGGLSWSIEGFEHYVGQGDDTDVTVSVYASGSLSALALDHLVTVTGSSTAAEALTAYINTY